MKVARIVLIVFTVLVLGFGALVILTQDTDVRPGNICLQNAAECF